MKDKKRYILKGVLSDIEMKIANTSEGDKDFATANLNTVTKAGKPKKVPILTFYPTGIDYLFKAKENSKVEVFGTFKKLKGTNGTNQFFELIGKHTKKEKNAEKPHLLEI